MSGARNARLTRAKQSSQSRCDKYHLLPLAMIPPHLLCHGLDFRGVLEYRVVAVPLNVIGAPHEGAVFGRAPVVVPEVEVLKVDGLLKRWGGQYAFFAQCFDDTLQRLHLL